EGKLTSETYPNAMCANYTYDAVGQATHLEYKKSASCTEGTAPVWYQESDLASVHGETLSEENTLAKASYTFDNAGRLKEVKETPTGKGCSERLYAYDEESNRESQTTREPGPEGKCATEGGSIQKHEYDEANRLTDAGVEYDAYGNITTMPAADAGGHELRSSFYVDNQVQSQTQASEHEGKSEPKTLTYAYDPAGRTLETKTETMGSSSTTIDHYDGPGGALAWASEEGGAKYTRQIPGIDGSLCAIQKNGGNPVLQLHDLHGNIVETASLSESETKPLSEYRSTEFGVPTTKEPPPVSWLGGSGIESQLSSGVITEGATSYVPESAITLQSEGAGLTPGLPEGSGPLVPYELVLSPGDYIGAQRSADEMPGIGAAEQKAAACSAHPVSCEASVDPEVSVLLTASQTRGAAAVLHLGATAIKVAAEAAPHGHYRELLEWLAQMAPEYMDGLVYGLNVCAETAQDASGENRCRVFVQWVVGFSSGKKEVDAWGVEICFGQKYVRGRRRGTGRPRVHWTWPSKYCAPIL
ncbi:MAG: hypothetical protein ACYDA6_10825, partial [Solirubrobacteraceae bacterium]